MSILQAIFHPAQDYRSLKHGHGVNPTCQHWLYVILHWSFWLWRLTCCWPATWLWIKQVQKMNEWLSFAMEVLHIWSVEHHQCFFFFWSDTWMVAVNSNLLSSYYAANLPVSLFSPTDWKTFGKKDISLRQPPGLFFCWCRLFLCCLFFLLHFFSGICPLSSLIT